MHLARIVDGHVFEILDGSTSEEQPPLAERYHPDFLAQCVPVTSDEVKPGWRYADCIFSPPEGEAPPE